MRKKLYYVLIGTSTMHKKINRQEFQRLDLSEGQPKVLNNLSNHEGTTQKELAEMCSVKPATMTSLLKNMINKGLIQKKSVFVSGGKRAFGIYLTDLGREKTAAVLQVTDMVEEISFQGFSEEEKNRLIELLQRVTDNLKSENAL